VGRDKLLGCAFVSAAARPIAVDLPTHLTLSADTSPISTPRALRSGLWPDGQIAAQVPASRATSGAVAITSVPSLIQEKP
jgi:hypothetical protein